uniref:Reverse transcriptase n=1 Tax=Cannabis sativa TaxID=3483 RepID=A0A803Q6T5_CANSA
MLIFSMVLLSLDILLLISHLFFVDDSLLFCTADRNSCLALQDVFNIYSKASEQAINFSKSYILFSPNTVPDIRALFFQIFNLEDRPFGCKYLGLPQCLTRSKYHSFTYLSDKVASVLRSWSSKCFSRAGKEVLLKAVIQAIPAYAMAYFRLPVKFVKELRFYGHDKAMREKENQGLKLFIDATIDSINRRHSIGLVVLDADNAVKAGFSAPFSGLVPLRSLLRLFFSNSLGSVISLLRDVLLTDCKSIVDKLNSCNWNNSVLDDVLLSINNLLSFTKASYLLHL